MAKILIVKKPEQCGYYGYCCGDCFHPKAKKWAGCGGEISKDCPLPDAPPSKELNRILMEDWLPIVREFVNRPSLSEILERREKIEAEKEIQAKKGK